MWVFVVVVFILLGCTHTPSGPTTALNLPSGDAPDVQEDAPAFQPDAPPTWPEAVAPLPDVPAREALGAIARANRAAVIRPRPGHFSQAIVVYPYQAGGVYAIDVGYHVVTDVVWPPHELIIAPIQGSPWFEIEQKTVGNPPQAHVLITSKLSAQEFPALAKQPYRLVVLTDRAAYYLTLRTHDDPQYAMVAVTWTHLPTASPSRREALFAPGVYRLGYDVTSRRETPPVWMPDGVWDSDAGHTWIHFPLAAQTTKAPVLFGVNAAGEKEVVTFVPRGRWYLVDRVLAQAELRVGHDDETAEVVTIQRGSHYRSIRCPQSPECPRGDR